MKLKQGGIVALVIIGIIIASVVLYQNNGKRHYNQSDIENYAEIKAVFEEYIMEILVMPIENHWMRVH